jgi:CRP-like cAMP-binding protein
MIGNDGAFGVAQALDDKVSLNKVAVQVSGTASVIDAEHLRAAAERSKVFRTLLIGFELFMLAQVQQTAACNALHDVQTRMCRWLLRMHDLGGVDLPLTQEFLAQMLGVRRTSVTEVAVEMQKAGMISYGRGRLHIIDLLQVQMKACECHEDVQSHYAKIIGRTRADPD